MKPQFLLWLGASTVAFLTATTLFRAYIGNGRVVLVVLALLLYSLGNLMMLKLMRAGGLGIAVSASAIAQLLLINVIAFVVFGERLTPMQMAGVSLGVVAMALMLYPTAGKA